MAYARSEVLILLGCFLLGMVLLSVRCAPMKIVSRWERAARPAAAGHSRYVRSSPTDCSWVISDSKVPPKGERPDFVKQVNWNGCASSDDDCALVVTFVDQADDQGDTLSQEFFSGTMDYLLQMWRCVEGGPLPGTFPHSMVGEEGRNVFAALPPARGVTASTDIGGSVLNGTDSTDIGGASIPPHLASPVPPASAADGHQDPYPTDIPPIPLEEQDQQQNLHPECPPRDGKSPISPCDDGAYPPTADPIYPQESGSHDQGDGSDGGEAPPPETGDVAEQSAPAAEDAPEDPAVTIPGYPEDDGDYKAAAPEPEPAGQEVEGSPNDSSAPEPEPAAADEPEPGAVPADAAAPESLPEPEPEAAGAEDPAGNVGLPE